MKISFDLDDTIIPGTKTFETEPQTIWQKLIGLEKIRRGTTELFKDLKNKNHSVGIYTTSFRSTMKIRLLFLLNGFSVDFVINQKLHLLEIRNKKPCPSKYPPAFGIDIHVDDSKGVEIEGEKHNFRTIIIDENAADWRKVVVDQMDNSNR